MKAALAGVAGHTFLPGLPARALGQSVIASHRLSDGVVLLTGAGANVVALTTPDRVVMVDGGLASSAPALLDAIGTIAKGARVGTLFNTHWHPEQTGANLMLGKAGATIVAHENTRLWMSTDITRPWETRTFPPVPKDARPNKTFYATESMEIGGERIEYGYLLQAHTDGDIYVFFPKSNVLVAGGVVSNDGWPLIDWWTGGWIGGLVNGLDALLEIGDASTRIVPANGSVMTRADLMAQRAMYGEIFERLRTMLRTGLSPDEAIAAQPTKEFNAKMGDPSMFIRLAFQSMWPQLSPDA
jgi:cyclase